jgi:hypothetical protein
MGYRLEWRLVGRENRLLDSGEIDNGSRDRRSAMQALSAFLLQFPMWGRSPEGRSWWAKRSRDADLKVLITLHEPEPTKTDILPAVLAAKSAERAATHP